PKIYVNGQESTTITADTWQYITIVSSSPITADEVYIGKQDTNFFDGSLDELRLYNRTLSPREVQALYHWAPGPVGYWNFDENTGSTANDISGNGNNGTITDATWSTGKFGSA